MVAAATRRLVVARADGRCEYCRVLLAALDVPLHIEHVRPRRHRGGDSPDNLAVACQLCNLHKGTDLTGHDPQTDALTPLFDPRRQAWDEHFRAVGGEVIGVTAAGRTTVELLAMNGEARLIVRAELAADGLWP